MRTIRRRRPIPLCGLCAWALIWAAAGCAIPAPRSRRAAPPDSPARAWARTGLLHPSPAPRPENGSDAPPSASPEKRPEAPAPEPIIEIEQGGGGSESPPPNGTDEPHEGLEAVAGWEPVGWALPCKVVRAASEAGTGRALVLSSATDPSSSASDKDKMGAVLVDPPAPPVSESTEIVFEARCEGADGALLAVALVLADGHPYYESRAIPLEKGERRRIAFPLGDKAWKSERTKWRFETAVPSGKIYRLIVLVYQPKPGLRIRLDKVAVQVDATP